MAIILQYELFSFTEEISGHSIQKVKSKALYKLMRQIVTIQFPNTLTSFGKRKYQELKTDSLLAYHDPYMFTSRVVHAI